MLLDWKSSHHLKFQRKKKYLWQNNMLACSGTCTTHVLVVYDYMCIWQMYFAPAIFSDMFCPWWFICLDFGCTTEDLIRGDNYQLTRESFASDTQFYRATVTCNHGYVINRTNISTLTETCERTDRGLYQWQSGRSYSCQGSLGLCVFIAIWFVRYCAIDYRVIGSGSLWFVVSAVLLVLR